MFYVVRAKWSQWPPLSETFNNHSCLLNFLCLDNLKFVERWTPFLFKMFILPLLDSAARGARTIQSKPPTPLQAQCLRRRQRDDSHTSTLRCIQIKQNYTFVNYINRTHCQSVQEACPVIELLSMSVPRCSTLTSPTLCNLSNWHRRLITHFNTLTL